MNQMSLRAVNGDGWLPLPVSGVFPVRELLPDVLTTAHSSPDIVGARVEPASGD